MLNGVVLKDVDDIDHLTIKRRQGKEFSAVLAVRFIKNAVYNYPAAAKVEAGQSAPENATEQELYDRLVAIRNALMEQIELY